jgi:hypothetical protein
MMVVDFFNASGNRLPRGGPLGSGGSVPLRGGGSEHLGDQSPRSYFETNRAMDRAYLESMVPFMVSCLTPYNTKSSTK